MVEFECFRPQEERVFWKRKTVFHLDWYKYRTICILYVIVYQTALFLSRWIKPYFKFTKSFINSFRFRQQFTFVVGTIVLLLFLQIFFALSPEKNNKVFFWLDKTELNLSFPQAETSYRTVHMYGWIVSFESGQVRNYNIGTVLSVRGSGPSGGFTASSVHCLPWIGCSQIEGSGRLVGHGVLQVSVTTGLPPEIQCSALLYVCLLVHRV